MSDGAISQAEIDALLNGVDLGSLGGGSPAPSKKIDVAPLQPIADGLKDKFSASLESMTGATFSAKNVTVESLDRDKFLAKLPEDVVSITADFNAGISGEHIFIIAPDFAVKLCSLINKEENPALDDMALSVVSEVVSSHSGAEVTDLCAGGRFPGLATNPAEASTVPKAVAKIPQGNFTLITYNVENDGKEYSLWEVIGADASQTICKTLGGANDAEELKAKNAPQAAPMPNMNAMGMQQPMMGGAMGMPQPMMGMPMGAMAQPAMGATMNVQNVQSLQFPPLQGGAVSTEQGNIGLLMDVFMEMTVELGRTKKQIKEILGLGEGTIIELDKLAGEPVDILVNHKAIAKGEVVVIDENFGVRVTEILSPIERVSDLH